MRLLRQITLPAARTGTALACAVLLAPAASIEAEESLFVSKQVTPSQFTRGIEGPAVDSKGNVYAVNFDRKGTIGVLPVGATKAELYVTLPDGSNASGIRIAANDQMFVADFKAHNVLLIDPETKAAKVYVHSSDFNQPNDLALAADGRLYASDPKFTNHTGRIWEITKSEAGAGGGVAHVMPSERAMHVTNGLDLSPTGKTLYVSESDTQEIWAYEISEGTLKSPRRIAHFTTPGGELDGLRVDAAGRIFVARPNAKAVSIVMPDGTPVRDVATVGKTPSNLTFGGPDGKAVFVTQVDGRFIESFRSDKPGREFCQSHAC